MTKRAARPGHVGRSHCVRCAKRFAPGEVPCIFAREDGQSFGPYHEGCGPKLYAEWRKRARALRLEPDPPEQMERRFVALGPAGPAALAALWARPRLRPAAWQVLDAIDHARGKLARARDEHAENLKAKDRERKAHLADRKMPPPPAPLGQWEQHSRLPGDPRPALRDVFIRRLSARRKGEPPRPGAFGPVRGHSLESDVLPDLRAQFAALGVPSRGSLNLLAALVALARPPRRHRPR